MTQNNEKIYDGNKSYRFSLGVKREKTIYCMGVNPSIATDKICDDTINRVKKIAEANGFNGWVMLNIYPQVATNPDDLHRYNERQENKHKENLKKIIEIIPNGATVWLAFGSYIKKRSYLRDYFKEICNGINNKKLKYVSLFPLNKGGIPPHPLAHKTFNEKLERFDLSGFLRKI